MKQVQVKTSWMQGTDISYSVADAVGQKLEGGLLSVHEVLVALIANLPSEGQRAMAEQFLKNCGMDESYEVVEE